MATITVPKPQLSKDGHYWIPPLPPHWDDWIGPYDSKTECLEVRSGLERTVNRTDWSLMMEDLVDQFEQDWNRRLLRRKTI